MSRLSPASARGWRLSLPLLFLSIAARADDLPQPPSLLSPPPLSEFQQMIDRPLFSNTRRPPALLEAPTENLDAKQLKDAWRLSGIVLENSQQLAIFSERQGDKRLQLEVGMVLADEWRLRRIERDRVWLGNDGTEVELLLREPQGPKESPEKPANPPAAGEKPGKPPAPASPATMAPSKGRTAVIEPVRKG
ncbi:hypothetical protein KRX52_02185 [Pseudomonas sp. MAP12]|uniref:General secretion pathway protein N n=1 Tax=Geopseudomonas aromaticivorans TaxID=2849492 RepID=A0ABS6MS20_9GAMM|nr:hypothetical protein [Pseudomonas aromaticivorans]MBV2131602.1 hypothetical protein [Pseudomonas aromaticivorans]